MGAQPDVNDSLADPNVPVEQTQYLAGFGVEGQETPYPNVSPIRYNGDMLRSTMLMTDQDGGTPVQWNASYQPVVSYTAFGDPVYRDPNGVEHVGPLPVDPCAPADLPRYQFAGGRYVCS
jgi:hypothetical protein